MPGNVLDLFGSSDWLGGAMRAAISVSRLRLRSLSCFRFRVTRVLVQLEWSGVTTLKVAVTLAFPMLCLPCRPSLGNSRQISL